jgi:hypothetical protein
MPEAKDWKAVLAPGVLSLFVTLLRLVGELQGWNPALFNKSAGGGGALLGITWLVIPFGAWFGWQVAREGSRPGSFPRAFGIAFLSFALLPAGGAVFSKLLAPGTGLLLAFCVLSLVGLEIARRAWPELGRRLLAYAFAARVPVALLMLPAILGNWGTHYDVLPPDFPEISPPLLKWLLIGVLPQMTTWLWFTLSVGALFGIPAAALASRHR